MRRLFAGLFTVVLLAGCASAGRSGTDANTARFERAVGTGSAPDVMTRSQKVIRQHQFEVRQLAEPPNIYIETEWRNRSPFEDEVGLGVMTAQTRLIVRARQRATTPLGPVFGVNVAFENRVRMMGSEDWTEASATDQYRRWTDTITEEFRRELNIGVRKY
jgi:hypothetical protein